MVAAALNGEMDAFAKIVMARNGQERLVTHVLGVGRGEAYAHLGSLGRHGIE